MKKQILITVSYIAEVEESLLMGNGQVEKNEKLIKPLNKRFPRNMKISDDIHAEWERTSRILLDPKYHNCTQCYTCGSWITDKSKPDYIAGLSVGEYVKEKIYCPECAIFACEKS